MKRVALGQNVNQTLHHVRHQVDADQVVKAENAGLGYAHRAAEDCVGFERRQPEVEGGMQRALDREDPDAVAEKARGIEAGYDALAELLFAEITQQLDDGGIGIFTAYQFEQAHEAYRVEKMGNRETASKGLRHILDQ